MGAALAGGISARGAKLILSGRTVAALDDVARGCCAGTMILPFAATDYAALPRIAQEAWGWTGRLDGRVTTAGLSQRSLGTAPRKPVVPGTGGAIRVETAGRARLIHKNNKTL